MNEKFKSMLLIFIFVLTLIADRTDDKPTCDGPEDTGVVIFDISHDNDYDPDLSCGNASTCNLSPIECMAGDYKINLDAIFGEKTDLKKWYVEIEANGKCSDGSNYTQKFTAGKNLSAQLNSSQISLEFYPTNASELFVGRDITFYLTIREPCREHTEDCILCLDNRHRYLNISDARIFATNVRTYQRRAFMLSVNTLGQECGCSL